jgi:Tfp pilus assembly protein PilN
MSARLIAYAVVAGTLLLVGWQWHARGQRIEALVKHSATLATEHAQCKAQQAADDQALADLRAAGEADRARREAAERAAAQAGVDAERKVRAALTARVPPECPAAMQWLGAYGRDLATRWEAGR